MTLHEVLNKSIEFLKSKKFESPRLDAELLLAFALGWQRIDLYVRSDYPLSKDEEGRCREIIVRRARGEPVAYLIGEKHFYGHSFKVIPGVLIPRPETEMLVELAQKNFCEKKLQDEMLTIVDLGCGSGCIGISILKILSNATLIGVDVAKEAVETSSQNAQILGVAERSQFLESKIEDQEKIINLLTKQNVSVDLVVSNPPYIDREDSEIDPLVKLYEPDLALFANNGGLEKIFTWANCASNILKPDGLLLFEIGNKQGEAVKEWFSKNKSFNSVQIIKDYAGKDRVVRAIKTKNEIETA